MTGVTSEMQAEDAQTLQVGVPLANLWGVCRFQPKMSLVPAVVGTVAATNAADVGIAGHILIAIAAAALFGPIGLVPLLGDEPKATPRPEWSVVDGATEVRSPLDVRIQSDALTIDGAFREIREPAKLAGGDPRWGR